MGQWNKDIISVGEAKTLGGLFRERVRRTPAGVAYRSFDKAAGTWLDMTWEQVAAEVKRWQAALAREDLQSGDRVAVLMRNGPAWVVFDQAALGMGLVVVPLYSDDRADNAAYILSDCSAKLLLAQDTAHWDRLEAALKPINTLLRILIASTEEITFDDRRMRRVDDWLAAASEDAKTVGSDPQRLASIVYTSGTTGRPKGVMLSHYNMLSNAHGVLSLFDAYREDIFLSVLPLSHTLERTGDYYLPMMAGATVAYSRSINQLSEDLQAVRPTVLICVPRLLERLYARIMEQMRKRSRLERWLFQVTVATGWRRFEQAQGRTRGGPLLFLWSMLERRVARPLLSRLGGRLRLVISGGAALPLPVARLFIALGVPVIQGYGLTETSPVISVNPPEDNDPTSVGVPLPEVELHIGESGELLVRGPGVMQGYWNNHSATHQAIDAEGWLHTGDQARIDAGHIYITGRIKDILVLSNGEKVPTADMEMAIVQDPLFEQAMVVGEGQAYLGALVVLNAEHWMALAAALGLDPDDSASLKRREAHKAVLVRTAKQLHDFPGYAKVRRVILLREPWTTDNGLLTPTLKLKRNQVRERYAEAIGKLFDEGLASPRKPRS